VCVADVTWFATAGEQIRWQVQLLRRKLLLFFLVITASEMTYIVLSGALNSTATNQSLLLIFKALCLQCLDTVGWAAGRASGL